MTTEEERDAYKKSLTKHALKYLRPIVKATLPECSVRADTQCYQPKFILSQEGFEEFHVILRFEGARWQKANLAGVKIKAPGYGEEQRRYGWKYGPELPRDITTGHLPNEKKFREGLRQLYDWHIAKQQQVTEAKEGAATAMAIMRDALKRPESCPYDGTLAVEEGTDELTVLLVSDEGPRMEVRLSASPDGTVSLAYTRQYGRRFGLFHLSNLTDPAVIAAAVHDIVLMHEEIVERCVKIEAQTKASSGPDPEA